MKILLVTDSYPPEIRSASHLMEDLASFLVGNGHHVTVVTSWPKYNLSAEARDQKFETISIESGVTVLRINTLPHHNVNYLVRGLSQLLMPLQFIYKIFIYRIKADVLIVYSPPLTLGLVGGAYRTMGKKFILSIQDLFPQNAIDLGILRNAFVIMIFKAIEKFVYSKANLLTVHSEGNLTRVIKDYPEFRSKTKVIHNWIDLNHFKNLTYDKTTCLLEEWGVSTECVAIFAGVLGPSQNIDLVLEIAMEMKCEKDLKFLIVGDGAEKSRLQNIVIEKNITNVQFIPFISRSEYIRLLSECDIGLVSLSPLNKTPVVPGKILDYMAAGKPVAAFLHAESDGHQLIRDAKCGISANSNNLQECIQSFKRLYGAQIKLNSIGLMGKDYLQKNLTKEKCIPLIEDMLWMLKE